MSLGFQHRKTSRFDVGKWDRVTIPSEKCWHMYNKKLHAGNEPYCDIEKPWYSGFYFHAFSSQCFIGYVVQNYTRPLKDSKLKFILFLPKKITLITFSFLGNENMQKLLKQKMARSLDSACGGSLKNLRMPFAAFNSTRWNVLILVWDRSMNNGWP